MLPNKSSNSMILDSGGPSSGPQPLLSTSVQPISNSFQNNNNKLRRPKMDSNSSSTNKLSHNKSGPNNHSSHHSHHHPSTHHQAADSKLYIMASIELKDSLEITLEDAYNKLKYLVCPSEQLQQKPDSLSFNELSSYSNRK